jgi:very-short-patch-repair endonuclease
MTKNEKITPQARKLHIALKERGIKSELEAFDGIKHVDISIPWAKLDIELDGLHHFLDPEQIHKDLERSFWSQENDEFDTLHIPNFIIDAYLNKVADAIAKVARDRYQEIKSGDL